MKYTVILFVLILSGCGSIPTQYTWDEVNYHRKGQDVEVHLKGRAELQGFDFGDLF